MTEEEKVTRMKKKMALKRGQEDQRMRGTLQKMVYAPVCLWRSDYAWIAIINCEVNNMQL